MVFANAWRLKAEEILLTVEEEEEEKLLLSRSIFFFKLRKKKDFLRVLQDKRRFIGSFLLVDIHIEPQLAPSFAVIVSSRYGNAVKRNRFKRMAREAFRLQLMHIPKSASVIIYPRQQAKTALYKQIQQELVELVNRVKA